MPLTLRLTLTVLATLALTAPTRADSTGTPVCDDYLKQFETCVRERTPEPERAEFLRGIDLARTQFRKMLDNRFKPDVAGACTEARKTVFQMLSEKYGCSFR